MKKQLSELRALNTLANAICRNQAFGDVITDLDIEDLAAKALKVIDEHVGDELGNAIKKDVEIQKETYGKITESGEYSDQAFNEALSANKDYRAVKERQSKLLEKEVDFEFTPVEVTIEKGQKLNFPEYTPVNFKGLEQNLLPYACFRELVNGGYITIKR